MPTWRGSAASGPTCLPSPQTLLLGMRQTHPGSAALLLWAWLPFHAWLALESEEPLKPELSMGRTWARRLGRRAQPLVPQVLSHGGWVGRWVSLLREGEGAFLSSSCGLPHWPHLGSSPSKVIPQCSLLEKEKIEKGGLTPTNPKYTKRTLRQISCMALEHFQSCSLTKAWSFGARH